MTVKGFGAPIKELVERYLVWARSIEDTFFKGYLEDLLGEFD